MAAPTNGAQSAHPSRNNRAGNRLDWVVAGALDGWLGTGWPWLGRDNLAVTVGWDSRLVPASLPAR